ncbi:MAG: hypothetical protein LBO09_09300 [Candidatus Peribacteria bacterium]|jgi:uncharacterized membrane protein YqiK|nr:hypothetical protein [Candidatus Peribacteria bacterium]
MEILSVVLSYWWLALLVILALVIFFKSFVIVGSKQMATIEQKYFGKEMTEGRTVALRGEAGIQAQLLGAGFHFLIPFLQVAKKYPYIVVQHGHIGIVEAITGAPIPGGKIMADYVDCNLFRDGEAFLRNGGQKGPQLAILPPGEYRINPYLFRVNPNVPEVNIADGTLCTVTAIDGQPLAPGRILADKVEGHDSFQNAQAFLQNGGKKGQQTEYLTPGSYRINTLLFRVGNAEPWTTIGPEEIGIVTTKEGHPITDPNAIAAKEIGLEVHQNFQDIEAFLQAGGEKGLQPHVLRPGSYKISSFFAEVDVEDMVEVGIGQCAVVTSFVGQEYRQDAEEQTDRRVNARLVPVGNKGIWNMPLGPGKHPLNAKTCKWNIVPTTQVVLSWADVKSSAFDREQEESSIAFEYDKGLSTITLRTADAWDVKMDVQVMFHIPMEKAPAVVADLGSMQDLISQVLEPAVSAHFRNAAQKVKALDLYTERAELAANAKSQISDVLGYYHIESRDVMITDVILPRELTEPVQKAAVAIEDEKKYKNEQKAQNARKDLEFAKKQADMQEALVQSEREIEISKNNAESVAKKAEGEKIATIKRAEAQAESVKLVADADAQKVRNVGLAEAEIILAKGKAQATSYDLAVKAMGDDYARLQIIESITTNGTQLIPQNIIVGGGSESGGSLVENFLGVSMIEKLTGKPFNPKELSQSENKKPQQVIQKTVSAQIAETLQPDKGKKKDQKDPKDQK